MPSQRSKLKKLKHFKRKLRSFLLQHIFYSVEEYMYNYLVKYNALFAQSYCMSLER
jgi:hypothetical protein